MLKDVIAIVNVQESLIENIVVNGYNKHYFCTLTFNVFNIKSICIASALATSLLT